MVCQLDLLLVSNQYKKLVALVEIKPPKHENIFQYKFSPLLSWNPEVHLCGFELWISNSVFCAVRNTENVCIGITVWHLLLSCLYIWGPLLWIWNVDFRFSFPCCLKHREWGHVIITFFVSKFSLLFSAFFQSLFFKPMTVDVKCRHFIANSFILRVAP